MEFVFVLTLVSWIACVTLHNIILQYISRTHFEMLHLNIVNKVANKLLEIKL